MVSPRPRLRFSLRTLLVLVTVLCVWLGYQLNWIQERREARELLRRNGAMWSEETDNTPAPLSLRVFGEKGLGMFWIGLPTETDRYDRQEMVAKFKRLFPEVRVIGDHSEDSPE